MTIAVCVKQVPELSEKLEITDSAKINRQRKIVLDDADRCGVELGLQIGEKLGQDVVVFCINPDDETAGIREALAMGADSAVFMNDEKVFYSNSINIGKNLGSMITDSGLDIKLIITGVESSDTYHGVIPSVLSQTLDFTLASNVKEVDLDAVNDSELKMTKQTQAGDVPVTASFPCIVSVTAKVVEPRYPNFKGIMAAKKKEIKTVDSGEITLGGSWGVENIDEVDLTKDGQIFDNDSIDRAIEEIVNLLKQEDVL